MLTDPTLVPEDHALRFVDSGKGIADVAAALEGVRAILQENFSEDPALMGALREWLSATAVVRANVVAGKEVEGAKYRDYFQHVEAIASIPSHRMLALLRARSEGVIELELAPRPTSKRAATTLADDPSAALDEAAAAGHAEAEGRVARHFSIADRARAADRWLLETARKAWRQKMHVHLGLDLLSRAREAAEAKAIASSATT